MTSDDDQGPSALWTVEDTASFLKLSMKHVYRLVESGQLPHFKLGRRVRVCPETLRAWVQMRGDARGGPPGE